MKKEKSCGCIIIEDGKVLVVQENEGHWGFPKGHIEEGETEVQTAIRETKEETNLDVEIDENKKYVINYIVREAIDKTVVYFLAKRLNNDLKRQESEIKTIEWLPCKDAIERVTYDNTKEMFKKVLDEMEIKY
jgi:8-oxo-dGTP pyrophosphatase MutT (NUDIX family)